MISETTDANHPALHILMVLNNFMAHRHYCNILIATTAGNKIIPEKAVFTNDLYTTPSSIHWLTNTKTKCGIKATAQDTHKDEILYDE